MSVDLLDLICDPESGEPLRRVGDQLVGESGCRWPVVRDVPDLLPARPDATARAAIVEASRVRSETYFADNYTGANPERDERLRCAVEILAAHVHADDVVLDAGAGPLVLAEPLHRLGVAYLGLDASLENVLAGVQRVPGTTAVVGDVQALPLRPDVFDAAVSLGCLEYVDDLERSVSELCRVVRPGGIVVASFANASSPRRRWDEAMVMPLLRRHSARSGCTPYRRRLDRVSDVTRYLERCGASILQVRYLNPGLLGYPFSQSRLLRRVQERLGSLLAPSRLSSEFVIVARLDRPSA